MALPILASLATGALASLKAANTSNKNGSSATNDDRDISAEMGYATTMEELSKSAIERQAKEDALRDSGQWNPSWAPTTELYSRYAGKLKEESAPARNGYDFYPQQSSLDSMRRNSLNDAKRQYDAMAQQAYIQKMQEMGSLPALLSTAGHTGGLSETAAMAPGLSYGNALTSIGTARADTMSRINQASDKASLDLAMDYANKMIAQANADRAFNYQIEQDALNRSYQGVRDEVEDKKRGEQETWNRAMQFASYGDFSLLRALGIDTAEMERIWRRANKL